MKKMKNYLVLFILFMFIGIRNIYADYYVDKFDALFASNEITLYTDMEITDESSLWNAIYYSIETFNSEYYNSPNDYSYLNLNISSCDPIEFICNFELKRDKMTEGVYSYESIKEYNNIHITVDSNVSSYFSMIENNILNINYDESMFSSEDEKEQYIRDYVNRYQENINNDFISYSYIEIYLGNGNDVKIIARTEMHNGETIRKLVKTIDDVVFDYVEEPFSETFKKLTEGTITIKTDSEITRDLLNDYLNNYFYSTITDYYNFYLDGNIVNNKAFIGMYKNSAVQEKHLITLVQDNNIDTDFFDNHGLGAVMDIPAERPTENISNYLSNYLGAYLNEKGYIENVDDTNDSFSYIYLVQFNDYVIIRHAKKDSNNNVLNIEYRKIDINFTGYNSTYSDAFTEAIGDELVVNGDSLNENIIRNTLPDYFRLLGCNNDYSSCDILYIKSNEQNFEIHPVAIVLNDVISETYSKIVGLKEDNTLDIVIGEDVSFRYNEFFYYYHNQETGYNTDYNCTGDKCNIRVYNYNTNFNESHTITFNRIDATPTESYLSLVKESIDVYPGDNEYVWDSLRYNTLFRKNEEDYRVQTTTCDSQTSKCTVMTLNSDNKVEIHNLAVNIKEGKSPRFSEIFPDDTIKLSSVYKNDPEYVYCTSTAYLMSKARTWVSVDNFADGKAMVSIDYIEKHLMNIEFVEGNEEHQQIVDDTIENIGNKNIKFYLDDLEMVNIFYYGGFEKFPVINSKAINDTLNSLINNDHITYSFAVIGGLGNPFYEELGAKLVLFYDGIGYGITESYVQTGVRKVIYIPDDTEETPEAYIAAAQQRIDNYLGADSGVVVKYGWEHNPEDLEALDMIEEFGITNFDNNIYYITHEDRESETFIVKDSSKIKDSIFNAIDVNNNINVSSDNANYPMNTIVSSEKLDEEDFEEDLEQIGVENAIIVDINLYSPSIGDIKDFEDTEFEVSIPIDKKLLGSTDLVAYYIDENGNVEEHPVTVGDYYGTFETDHFSTYIIAKNNEAQEEQVPVYRLYNPTLLEHLYTTDANEAKVLYEEYGWGFEGIGWYSPNTGTPVYRLYNPGLSNHLYTSDANEIEVLTTEHGWVKDNDGKPVMYSTSNEEDAPIYRVYNESMNGMHHLTTDENEYNTLPVYGWQQEGISMRAVSRGVPITTYYFAESNKPLDLKNISNNILD